MKRVEEKVKDIVDVRAFKTETGLGSDPAAALAGYRFTDITADLMAKWLDALEQSCHGTGAALALAGFRGVGKSHFLSTLAAIVSNSHLREKIPDQHVASAAGRLPRRSVPVLKIRRGLKPTLSEEIREAVSQHTGVKESELPKELTDLLITAAGDNPLMILIDTSMERETRVTRDDGPMLSEMAALATSLGIFVGLALDDDIAGADGANLAISRSFRIDYLDQEHLYKIVDAHIFSKKDSALPLLHSIYKYYHDALPGFRWSEQRFVSLYPLHPAALEIAPLIRLYLHEFALLGFASEAGLKILGRPANSLIGIDEVFDSVESRLRQVAELDEAFSAFDKIDQEVVSKQPVNIRLFAKLILKGLFMSSLDGTGTSASELAAAMLVVDADRPGLNIGDLLESFSAFSADAVVKSEVAESEPTFTFKLRSAEDLKAVLDERIASVPPDAVISSLIRLACERYSDLSLADDGTSGITIQWRGSLRRLALVWDLDPHAHAVTSSLHEWRVLVGFSSDASQTSINEPPVSISWRLATLSPEEIATFQRLHILQTDIEIRERFQERAAAETQLHAVAAERIWKRIFIGDGILVIDNADHHFNEQAAASNSLSGLFESMLGPVLESRFTSHPTFARTLGDKETIDLTAKFFGNASARTPEVQELAESFAKPLGLAVLDGDHYVPTPAAVLRDRAIYKNALADLQIVEDEVIPIEEIYRRLAMPPFGLSTEAQHLVLAALVAERELEFVTFSGNRINHRSLDLQILWDDVAGVSKASAEVYTGERLLQWARVLTGNQQIRSLESPDDRLSIIDALSGWLSNWRTAKFLDAFDGLSDENLNSNIWKTASSLRVTFEAVAGAIEQLVANAIPLDVCLHSLAELFSDSLDEYERKKHDLLVLRYFIDAAENRREILEYLLLTEITENPSIEALRRKLLENTGPAFFAAEPTGDHDLENLWRDFKESYTRHYLERHNEAMEPDPGRENLPALMRSDKWTAFQSLNDVPWFDRSYADETTAILRQTRQLHCTFDTAQLLSTHPSCSCSFQIGRVDPRKDNAARLEMTVDMGLQDLVDKLNRQKNELGASISAPATGKLSDALAGGFTLEHICHLSAYETVLLKNAVFEMADAGVGNGGSRHSFDPRSLFHPDPGAWESEIDNLDIFTHPGK